MNNKRTKAFSAMFVCLAAVLLLSMSISIAYATKPIPVSGSFFTTPGTGSTTQEKAGESDNYIVTFSGVTVTWTGDVAGTGSWNARWVAHNIALPLGDEWYNTKGHYAIDATVDDKSGTLYIEACSNSGNPQAPRTWRIVGSTDELANIHGQGIFVPDLSTPSANDYLYSGEVHFDP
jgi:hypothetical protein